MREFKRGMHDAGDDATDEKPSREPNGPSSTDRKNPPPDASN